MARTRYASRLIGTRIAVGGLAVALFGAAAGWSVSAVLRQPHVPQITMAAIAIAIFVAVVVMAVESISSSVVVFGPEGYRRPMGGLRPWGRVVRVGTGMVEGRPAVTVALLAEDGDFPVTQDEFASFSAPEDVAGLVAEFLRWAPEADRGDFSGVELGAGLKAEIEATAARVAAEVEKETGRRPLSVEWIEFGYPGLRSALLLDYGPNQVGEGVQVIARNGADLAIVVDDRRWLRVTRKRTPPVPEGVAALFGAHDTTRHEADGVGFDRLIVEAEGQRPVQFNAEEPDRFA